MRRSTRLEIKRNRLQENRAHDIPGLTNDPIIEAHVDPITEAHVDPITKAHVDPITEAHVDPIIEAPHDISFEVNDDPNIEAHDDIQVQSTGFSEEVPRQKKKRGRGPARYSRLLSNNGPTSLEWNDKGQPIGPEEDLKRLKGMIGLLARRKDIWPVHIDYPNQAESCYRKTWTELKGNFNLEENDNGWNYVFERISSRIRDWRNQLKKIWEKNKEDEDEMWKKVDIDPRIDKIQFAECVKQWETSHNQDVASINKQNRCDKVLNHKSGKKSYAEIINKLEKDKGKVPSELDIMDQVYCNQPIMTEIHDYIDVHANEEMENCGNFASEAYNDIIKPRKTNRLRCIGGGSNLSTQSCNTAKGVKSKFVDASQTKNEERITNLEGEIHDIKDLIKKLTDNQEKYLNLFPPHIANCYTYPPPPHPYHSYMHLVSQHGSTGASGASINEQAYMYSQRADERNLRADERNLRADERNLRADGRNMNEDGYQSHAAGNRR